MELLIWLLYGAGLYVLLAAGYKLWISVKALRANMSITSLQIGGFAADPVNIQKAQPSNADDLPKLLFDRRARSIAKERARRERRRRLIDRISSINIDKRSA